MATTLYPQAPIVSTGPYNGFTILSTGTSVPDSQVARIVSLAAGVGVTLSIGAPGVAAPVPVQAITTATAGAPTSTAFPLGTPSTDSNGAQWVLTAGGWVAGAAGSGGATMTNVKSSGATGNGTTDDTAAIHSARDAAGVGGTVYFPPGTYLVSGLTVNLTGQSWDLHPNATIKAAAGITVPLVVVSAAGVTIRRGTLDGNRASQSSSNVAAIYTGSQASTDLTVDDVKMQHFLGYGVQSFASRTKVRRCTLSDVGSVPILIAPTITGATGDIYDCEVVDCLVDRSGESAATISTAGIQLRGGGASNSYNQYRAKVRGNTVVMPASPTSASYAAICIEAGGRSHYATISGNTCWNGSMGISLDASDGCTITGNTIVGPSGYGVEVAGSKWATVTANTVDGQTLISQGAICTTGRGSGGNSDYCTISGNTLRNLKSGGRCILLTTGSYSTITGNVMIANGQAIQLEAVGNSVVSGNQITGPGFDTTAAVFLHNSTGVVIVHGNRASSFTNLVRVTNDIAVTTDLLTMTSNVGKALNSGGTLYATALSGSGAVGANVINANNQSA